MRSKKGWMVLLAGLITLTGCNKKIDEEKLNLVEVEESVVEIADKIHKEQFKKLPVAKKSKLSSSTMKDEYRNAFVNRKGSYRVEDRVQDGHIYGVMEEDRLDEEHGVVEFQLNANHELISFHADKLEGNRPLIMDDKVVQERHYIGSLPQLEVILTRPNQVDDAPVIVFVDDVFAVRKNQALLDFLSYELASHGYATVSMQSRIQQRPSLQMDVQRYDLKQLYQYDYARLLHALETYPVDAGKISLFGIGAGANLIFDMAYHHFEVNDKLVLLNPIDETDGIGLWTNLTKEETTVQKTLEPLLQASRDKSEIVEGYPLLFWQQMKDVSMRRYYKAMVKPILLIETNNKKVDVIPSLNGINVLRLPYETSSQFLEDFGDEFQAFYEQEDIFKLREKKEKGH